MIGRTRNCLFPPARFRVLSVVCGMRGCQRVSACDRAAMGVGSVLCALQARLDDLRSTFAPNALARNKDLRASGSWARRHDEAHYGALIDTAHDAILTRLESIR